MNYSKTRSSNICKEGKSRYRFRMMLNGVKVSKNFDSYRKALDYKNDFLNMNR